MSRSEHPVVTGYAVLIAIIVALVAFPMVKAEGATTIGAVKAAAAAFVVAATIAVLLANTAFG